MRRGPSIKRLHTLHDRQVVRIEDAGSASFAIGCLSRWEHFIICAKQAAWNSPDA
jgi:hypothetical protein